jgi:hypothetical protein
MADELLRLRAVTKRRQKADEEWREAIRTAVGDGLSLRQVADAAGITHVGVLRITREQKRPGKDAGTSLSPALRRGDGDARAE